MSVDALTAAAGAGPATPPQRAGSRAVWILAGAVGLFVALSLVRLVTGTPDLTSSGAIRAALQLAVPIGLAALGGLWSERAGVVNIGLEGMMILGSWAGAWGSIEFGPWAGIVFGLLGGALGGLVHAVATVSFGVDHIVSGVAVTILAGGVARYLSSQTFADMPGGGITQSPSVPALPEWSVPGLSALSSIERHRWLFVSDLAGILRGAFTEVSALTVIAVLLVPLSYWILWRTAFGLRLRSCGEHPRGAESLGVNVYLYKYLGVVASGALAGLGGAFLSTVASSIYREGQTGGRGYIGLAAMIFGNWRPGGLTSGALLFGYTDSVQQRGGGESVHGLLALVALLLVIVAAWQVAKGHRIQAGLALAGAVFVTLWFFADDVVPNEFVQFAPHLTTLMVLAFAAQRLRPPAADGIPYRRGG